MTPRESKLLIVLALVLAGTLIYTQMLLHEFRTLQMEHLRATERIVDYLLREQEERKTAFSAPETDGAIPSTTSPERGRDMNASWPKGSVWLSFNDNECWAWNDTWKARADGVCYEADRPPGTFDPSNHGHEGPIWPIGKRHQP